MWSWLTRVNLCVSMCVCFRVPLVVEMWHRDPSAKDVLLGTASIQLSHLLTADKSRFLGLSGQQHWRQSFTERIPVLKAHG